MAIAFHYLSTYVLEECMKLKSGFEIRICLGIYIYKERERKRERVTRSRGNL